MRPGVRVGVDVGTVRVGVARSDPSALVATPVETLRRDAGGSRDLDRIAGIVAQNGAVEVVVGLPRTLRGEEGSAAAAARQYATAIAQRVAPVGVRLVDERLSTVSAHRTLHDAGVRGRRHRPVIDQVAAVVILQSALDAERASGRPPGALVAPGPSPERPATSGEEGGA
ncbi:MAG TPA: Holliday junction resolvase RuvX [Kineosporiaceae bacterium]|nr:Holliday junction resolvase RuvX [Kineosporiaceae bacterium]